MLPFRKHYLQGKNYSVLYRCKSEPCELPLAEKLFEIEGVKSVKLGSDYVVVTKSNDGISWDTLKLQISKTLHRNKGLKTVENMNKKFQEKLGNVKLDGNVKLVLHESGVALLELKDLTTEDKKKLKDLKEKLKSEKKDAEKAPKSSGEQK